MSEKAKNFKNMCQAPYGKQTKETNYFQEGICNVKTVIAT